jgi:ribosome-associated translation inhibitor RaiA
MQPLSEVRFLDLSPSPAVEKKIRERARRLTRFSHAIQNWQAWIESPRGHHRQGPITAVRVRLTVPGEELVAEGIADDVFVCVRDAFDAIRRKLQDYERRRRGAVKAHPRTAASRHRARGAAGVARKRVAEPAPAAGATR